MAEAAGQEEGRVPRTIEVELTGPLVDSCAAGDAVTVLGFVKVIAANPAAAGASILIHADKKLSFLYIRYSVPSNRSLVLDSSSF